jgi:hypothetical protein
MKVDVPELGGEIEQTTDISDYRSVDGFKVPFVTKVTNSAQVITITFDKVEHDTPIVDSMFSKPAAKQEP